MMDHVAHLFSGKNPEVSLYHSSMPRERMGMVRLLHICRDRL